MRILFILFVILPSIVSGQFISATYESGDIPTSLNNFDPTCTGPVTTLSIQLPPGGPWQVIGIDIIYTMTALGSGWKSDQRSQIHFQNTNTTEGAVYPGTGNTTGSQAYNRTGVDIANGIYPGNTDLIFEMRAWRTFGTNACNFTFNIVNNSLWKIIVYYNQIPPDGNIGIGTQNPDESALLDLSSFQKGFLPPRMSTAFRASINNPAKGLVVYDTDLESIQVYNGNWQPLATGQGSQWDFNGSYLYYNGSNVGIGTSSPGALLHVNGNTTGSGNVLFSGAYKSSNPGPAPATGAGTRMMWYPDKAAFRAGKVNGSQWNTDEVGDVSNAWGDNTKASSYAATAWGFGTTASSLYATAWGDNTYATEQRSTAWGYGTEASGTGSTAWGDNTSAFGYTSTAWGSQTAALSQQSTAWGGSTTASNTNATAWGSNTTASGQNSTAWGSSSTASGSHTSAFGQGVIAPSGFETALGRYNTTYTPNSSTDWNTSDRLFVIGNGTATNSRSNAMVVLKSGNTGIGTSTPTERLDVNGNARVRSIASGAFVGPVNRTSDGTFTTATSDARLKENIRPLENGLDKTRQLQGVTYTWKESPELGKRIGFIAQDVEKVLPELVFTNEVDGYLGLNYAEITAVLTEAIKEQQAVIEQLLKRMEILERMIQNRD